MRPTTSPEATSSRLEEIRTSTTNSRMWCSRAGHAEVRGGMPLPPGVIDLISHRTLPSATLRLAAHAELVGPREAVRLGLAYEVVGVEELISTAVDRAAALDALDADAYATTKRRVTRDLVDAMTRSMSS